MAFALPEPDDDDDARTKRAIANFLGITVAKLATLGLHKGYPEGKFIEGMDVRLNVLKQLPADNEVQRIKELAWKYRRQMPRSLAPKLPPHDPIVQEMEKQNV